MPKISVVVNTRNEEKNLPRALSSVKDLADEIVVVDMQSTDKTQEIAKKAGAKVYEHPFVGYVEPARNFAVGKATGDWILVLDADEEVSDTLAKKLAGLTQDSEYSYFSLPRKNIIFGKWIKHSRWWPDYNIRFFKKGAVSWSEIIHSVPETRGKGLDLAAEEEFAIVHHHYSSVGQYLARMNTYTTEHAKLLIKDGYKFSWRDLVRKPVSEFLSRYFFARGYKDGVHGLALSLLQAFSELVLYLKVWEAEKFRSERPQVEEVIRAMKEMGSEVAHWQAEALFKEQGGIVQRIKKKLKLL